MLLCLSPVPSRQTTRLASEASSAFRRTGRTSPQLDGITSRRWRSTSPRPTTRRASGASTGWACKTRARWGGSTMRKSTSTSLRKVLPCLFLFSHFVTSCLSLSDYKSGFGGKFGVQNDRVDASAVGWEHHEKVDKHESQKGELCIFSLPICPDVLFFHLFCFLCMSLLFLSAQDYKTGFGGQFGVQNDRVDASAAGWDHVEKVPKHPSQQGRIYAICIVCKK